MSSDHLRAVLESRRDELEAALLEAEQELLALDERRSELVRLIERARAALGDHADSAGVPANQRLTAHDAMVEVLKEHIAGLSAEDLAMAVARSGLYQMRDGSPIRPSQVHARVTNYPDLFERRAGKITLRATEGVVARFDSD